MAPHPRTTAAPGSTPGRVLLVVDWAVDARAVVDAVCKQGAADIDLVVPARLHGLDWIGDPHASVPCAERQLRAVTELARPAGLEFESVRVGDPEPLAAICDAVADRPPARIVLCGPESRTTAPPPFDLAARVRRATGLPVCQLTLPPAARGVRRRWLRLRGGHCVTAESRLPVPNPGPA